MFESGGGALCARRGQSCLVEALWREAAEGPALIPLHREAHHLSCPTALLCAAVAALPSAQGVPPRRKARARRQRALRLRGAARGAGCERRPTRPRASRAREAWQAIHALAAQSWVARVLLRANARPWAVAGPVVPHIPCARAGNWQAATQLAPPVEPPLQKRLEGSAARERPP